MYQNKELQNVTSLLIKFHSFFIEHDVFEVVLTINISIPNKICTLFMFYKQCFIIKDFVRAWRFGNINQLKPLKLISLASPNFQKLSPQIEQRAFRLEMLGEKSDKSKKIV